MAEVELRVIKGGRLIDGTGAEPIEKATVIIEGSKIKAVGRDIEVPEGAEVIDATGKTVMPGLIDSHLHLSGSKSDAHFGNMMRPQELSLIKAISDTKNLLAAGYTTVKCCGGTNAVFLREAVSEGTLSGLPRIVAAGYWLSQTFGHGDAEHLPPECVDVRTSRHSGAESLICDGVDECIKAARYALRFGADFIKLMGTSGLRGDVQFNLDEIKAIVETAAQAGKFVTAHCSITAGAKNSIPAGVKTIDHAGEMSDEMIALAKERGAIFVSTLAGFQVMIDHPGVTNPPEWVREGRDIQKAWQQALERSAGTYKRIHEAGATLATGTDYFGRPLTPFGKNAIELELLVKYSDFTPMEAIVAATRNGAMACFRGDRTGTIEPGKFADIIIVDGNPLADIKLLQDVDRIKMVMLEGKVEVNRGL